MTYKAKMEMKNVSVVSKACDLEAAVAPRLRVLTIFSVFFNDFQWVSMIFTVFQGSPGDSHHGQAFCSSTGRRSTGGGAAAGPRAGRLRRRSRQPLKFLMKDTFKDNS